MSSAVVHAYRRVNLTLPARTGQRLGKNVFEFENVVAGVQHLVQVAVCRIDCCRKPRIVFPINPVFGVNDRRMRDRILVGLTRDIEVTEEIIEVQKVPLA